MRERKAPPIITTTDDALKRARLYAKTPLEEYDIAESLLRFEADELEHLRKIRKAWLLQACNRIGNAPVRHPRDGRV